LDGRGSSLCRRIKMKTALLFLMVILSSSSGFKKEIFKKPFTAFRSYLVGKFQRPSYQKITYSSRPSQNSYSTFTKSYQAKPNIQKPFGFQRQFSSFTSPSLLRGNIPVNRFTSGNIVEVTKAQAKEALALLKSWEGNPTATQYIDPIFETSNCLNNIGDAVRLIEQGRDIVIANGPEIIYLEALVEGLNNEKDIKKLLKGSSKMLKTLDGLTENLASQSLDTCLTSPESSVEALEDLARALTDISNNRNLNVPFSSKRYLEFSSNVMEETAKFIRSLNSAIKAFESDCQNDNRNHVAVYESIEDIMVSLGKLFTSLGFDEKATAVNEQAKFLNKLAGLFDNDTGDFNLILECTFAPRSYNGLANLLDDVAELIDSVGIESLSEDLGINFNLF